MIDFQKSDSSKITRKAHFVLLFTSFILLVNCTKKEDAIQPEVKDLVESVYSSVTLKPDSLYAAYSAVSGIVESVLKVEGDLVTKDEVILKIVNSKPALNTENAKFNLELARLNYQGSNALLADLESEYASANLRFKNDSLNFARQKRLWEQGVGSLKDFDGMRLNFEVSENNLKVVGNKYKRAQKELKTQLRQAENNFRSSSITNKEYSVKSMQNGKIYELLKNPGELVSLIEPVAWIGNSKNYTIEMLVDEVDISRLRLGQKILIVLEAYPEKVFEAELNQIAPKMDGPSQTFLVKGKFNEEPEMLYSGLTGEANIIISNKNEVLTIPLDYLMAKGQVRTKDGIVELELGLRNGEFIEVLSGLTKESEILKPKAK